MKNFNKLVQRYRAEIDLRLAAILTKQKPVSMYDAGRYVLNAGGKRVRPLITLFSCESVGGTWRRALPAALAVEILHNFTLVHDDIMDASDSRRGRTTVHKRWNENVAILVGDALIAVAYHSLLESKSPRHSDIATLFTDGLLEVCEGQTFDMEFEGRADVTVDDYLLMIEKKTGALLKMSAAVGGVIGNATKPQLRALEEFGRNIGLAFQIRDDLLDIQADAGKIGKPMYNDIRTGKRTFLLLYANDSATASQRRILHKVFKRTATGRGDIDRVVRTYRETGAAEAAERAAAGYTAGALKWLERLPHAGGRDRLARFAETLVGRDY
jgi:geranylgeranyl diphosphate synthase, type II